MDTREKILSRGGLHDVLDEHRRAGRKVVFAHGVFDLMHVGHVRYLRAAQAEGDLLVVAVHSDASVRKLKEVGPPILTERARASLVAALSAVDYVVIFDESGVNAVLREFQPDVHAIMSGNNSDTGAGACLESLLGTRVVVVGDESSNSTTEFLARQRRENND
jgi:D-glycero-beta-D-manno-heptose 1-phosphate adenylyltransferase